MIDPDTCLSASFLYDLSADRCAATHDCDLTESLPLQGTDPRREKEDLVTSAALITAGELTKANVILERIIQRDPDNCESLHMQAVIAFRHGEMDMAKIAVDRAIKLEPEAHFYNNRGWVA